MFNTGGWLAEGFGSHQPFFFFYDVALCLPGAILRGLVASILRRSSISLLALLCLCCLYLYLFLYLVYPLVADDVPRHLGLLMFVADDLPRYLLQRLSCLYSSGVVPAQDLTCVAQSAGT